MIWQDLKGEDGRFHFEPLDRTQFLLEETPKGSIEVCGPNILFYLFGMTRNEYNDVFDPGMSEKLKCVFNEGGVCYRNKTLRGTMESLVGILNPPGKYKIG